MAGVMDRGCGSYTQGGWLSQWSSVRFKDIAGTYPVPQSRECSASLHGWLLEANRAMLPWGHSPNLWSWLWQQILCRETVGDVSGIMSLLWMHWLCYDHWLYESPLLLLFKAECLSNNQTAPTWLSERNWHDGNMMEVTQVSFTVLTAFDSKTLLNMNYKHIHHWSLERHMWFRNRLI